MASIDVPADFKEFLRLLNANAVEYLLIGGYAVAHHGYPRATGDMDIWVRSTPGNARKVGEALRQFGFDLPELTPDLFVQPNSIVRMGVPPLRLEIATGISGVDFGECFDARLTVDLGGVEVCIIDLAHLKANKRAAGRHKDLDDLEHLP